MSKVNYLCKDKISHKLNRKKKLLILGDVKSSHLKKWIEALSVDYELGVFSFNSIDQIYKKDLKDLNIQHYCREKKGKSNKLSYFFQFFRLTSTVKNFKPDIIHAHYASSYGFFGALVKKDNFIVSAWGSDIFEFPKKSFLHKIILKFVMRKASLLMSTSNIMAEEMKLYTDKKVAITPFGISTDLFQPTSRQKNNKFIVGTVKSLEHIYGIDILIKSFKKFNEIYPNSECHIYGKGSRESEYIELVKTLDLSRVVKLKGFVQNEKVPDVLNTFNVFCAFSRAESFGVAVLEASSCAIPVVVNDVGGLKEVAINNHTGYILDANDSHEIAQKFLFLANNNEECIKLGNNGRKWVLEKYDWTKSVQIMKSEYEKLLAKI